MTNHISFQGTLQGPLMEMAQKTADERGWIVEDLLTQILVGGIVVEADVNSACEPGTSWSKPQTSRDDDPVHIQVI